VSESIDSHVVRGTVINVNAFGATVRLENGELASVSAADVEAHRVDYERAWNSRKALSFERRDGRRPTVVLAPQIRDETLDDQIMAYLKSTESWESPDGVPAHQRHFLHKKKRAALFEARDN
jgi:hypothetical protein